MLSNAKKKVMAYFGRPKTLVDQDFWSTNLVDQNNWSTNLVDQDFGRPRFLAEFWSTNLVDQLALVPLPFGNAGDNRYRFWITIT